MDPGYREYAPPAALRDVVACVWVRVADGTPTTILPDACSDLIWQAGRGTFVAGPDTGPVPTTASAGTVFVGVRLHPGAGGPALGIPLSELRDRRVDARELGRRLEAPGDLEPREAMRRLLAAAVAAEPDAAVVEAARRLRDPRVRLDTLAADLGLSERQLRRRCHAAAGYGAKTLQRVLRFRRFLASAAGTDLARAALDAGYADQPHLTREIGRLAGTTPAALHSGR